MPLRFYCGRLRGGASPRYFLSAAGLLARLVLSELRGAAGRFLSRLTGGIFDVTEPSSRSLVERFLPAESRLKVPFIGFFRVA